MSGEKGRLKQLMCKIGYFIKKHKFMIIILILVIIAICVFCVWKNKQNSQRKEKKQSIVQTTVLKKRDLSSSVSVTGTIASADKREITTNLNDTEITEIAVEVGDYVEEGATIIVFDKSDLEDSYETTQDDYELNSLKQNQSLEQAKESVTEAQENYEKGVSEQASMVADSLSEYNTAQANEADALSAYETAQKNTEKAKEAYEKLKEKKSSLKTAMNNAKNINTQKQAALSQAKTAYEAAEANIKYASESDENYAALNKAYTDTYNAYCTAQTEADQAQKDYEKAKNEYDAVEQAKSAYESAKTAEEQAKTAYEQAANNTSNKSANYNSALQAQSETNEKNAELIEDSKENLTITSKEVSNNLKSQSKQLKEAEEKLGKCVVTSPISGYITSINVEVGDTYNGTDTLFVVQDMTELVVDATVDEYDIASLKKDQEAVIKTDATGDEELSGILTYVSLTPDESNSNSMGSSSSTSNYTIQISLNDTNENLRIGMTAKTSIILESVKEVYAVAYDCVETDKEGNSFITILDENASNTSSENANATKKISVEVGMESDYYVEIKSDELKENMKVVTPEVVGSSTDEKKSKDFMMGGFGAGGGMPDNNGGNRGNKGNGGNMGGSMPSGGF